MLSSHQLPASGHQEKPSEGSGGAPIRPPQHLGAAPEVTSKCLGGDPKTPGGSQHQLGRRGAGYRTAVHPPEIELGQGKEIAKKQNFHRVADPHGCLVLPAPPGRYSG